MELAQRRYWRWLLLIAAWLAAAPILFAHDPGLSSIRITVTPAGIESVLTIHFVDLEGVAPGLDPNHDGQLEPAEFALARSRLLEIARHQVECGFGADGLEPLAAASDAQVELIGNNNLLMTAHFAFRGALTGKNRLTVASPLIGQLPLGHRQFVEVLVSSDGEGLGEGFLVTSSPQLSFELPSSVSSIGSPVLTPPRQIHYGAFLFLGANHLLSGYDHLLFLAGLLIVCPSLLKAFQMLTLFTIAHSVTLTLVTLDWIQPSSALVEPMIAASIAYIGVENILRPRADLSWRGGLTFGFGLVHGLGFAGALRELGVGTGGTSGVFQPLLYFSVGLEATQLSIAALIFPLLLWLRAKPIFLSFWVPVLSSMIALAGMWWFCQRTFAHGI